MVKYCLAIAGAIAIGVLLFKLAGNSTHGDAHAYPRGNPIASTKSSDTTERDQSRKSDTPAAAPTVTAESNDLKDLVSSFQTADEDGKRRLLRQIAGFCSKNKLNCDDDRAKPVIELLSRLLSSSESLLIRQEALLALGSIAGEEPQRILEKYFTMKDFRYHAAEAMGLYGMPERVAFLINEIQKDQSTFETRNAAVFGIGAFEGESKTVGAMLSSALRDATDGTTKLLLLGALSLVDQAGVRSYLSDNPDTYDILGNFLESGTDGMAIHALNALSADGTERGLDVLLDKGISNRDITENLAAALAAFQEEKLVGRILEAERNTPQPEKKVALALGIAMASEQEGGTWIKDRFGAELIQSAKNFLSAGNSESSMSNAVKLLYYLGTPQSLAMLEETALSHSSPAVRTQAVWSVYELKGQDSYPFLLRVRETDNDAQVRDAATQLLNRQAPQHPRKAK